jgi:hypothetical protein
MNLLLILTALNFLGGAVEPLATVVAAAESLEMGERKQVEATTNRLPSFPCSAVVEGSDSAGAMAAGGLAGGEPVDASTAPFVIKGSCA